MDWYSWLSKTNIDPSFVYEYGLAFVRNELQEEDLTHFNHEFLQSLGISIAKHRLEIIKLARKEAKGRTNSLSKLVLAMSKTRKLLTKNIMGKWSFHKSLPRFPVSEPSPYRNQWSGGALKRINGSKEKDEKGMVCYRDNVMWSGPLDRRMQEKLMVTSCQSVSGPLDKMGYFCKSPTVNGPMEKWGLSPKVSYDCGRSEMGGGCGGDNHDLGVHSLWSLMFQDMKPT